MPEDFDRFTQVPNDILAAMARPGLTGNERQILTAVALANFRWPEPRTHISSRFLEIATGIHRRSVRRALDDLVEKKVLEHVPGSGTRAGNYLISAPHLWASGSTTAPTTNRSGVYDGWVNGNTTAPTTNSSRVYDGWVNGRTTAPTTDSTSGRTTAPTTGRTTAPTSGAPPRRPFALVGAPARPLVGAPLRPNKRESKRDLSPTELLTSVNAAFAHYPNPTTGRPKQLNDLNGSARRTRFSAIVRDHLEGDASRLGWALAAAVHGYVCRCGIKRQESGWDPWKHFELDSIANASNFPKNFQAIRDAIEIGNKAPFSQGGHEQKRGARKPERAELERRREARDRDDAAAAERQRKKAEFEKLSPLEILVQQRTTIESSSASEFKTTRLQKINFDISKIKIDGGAS